MKQKITLNEGLLRKMVRESVRRALTEGSTDQKDYNDWLNIQEMIGSDQMIEFIWNYLDCDMLHKLVQWFKEDLDIEDEEEDEEEEVEDDSDLEGDEQY